MDDKIWEGELRQQQKQVPQDSRDQLHHNRLQLILFEI